MLLRMRDDDYGHGPHNHRYYRWQLVLEFVSLLRKASRDHIHSGLQHHLDGGVGPVLNGERLGSILEVEDMGNQGPALNLTAFN